MNPQLSLSPFGPRPLSLALMASEALANTCPADKVVNKWSVHRAICEAKVRLEVSDRALAVLHALLSFYPDTTLTAEDAVVFPSNRELTLRSHGMAPATLRRHLALLVDRGLIIRRDSPNGKRYARKGAGGEIERAFGFDLSPLIVRAEEFENLAEEVRRERRRLALLREEISIYRRDIAKMIAVGLDEGIAADWSGLLLRLRAESQPLSPGAGTTDLEPCAARLGELRREVHSLLENQMVSQKTSANESQNEPLHLDSNTDAQIESEPAFEKGGSGPAEVLSPPVRGVEGYPLGMVLKACPDIADYARSGISSWSDFLATAQFVRPMLGISPSAFEEAHDVMGPRNAATAIAALLQKGPAVKSPGGYLRSLTRKARTGQFSMGPMLMALMKERDGKVPTVPIGS